MFVSNNYQVNFTGKDDPVRAAVRAIKRQAYLAEKHGASFYQDKAEIPIRHKVLASVTLYVQRLDEARVAIQLFFRDGLGNLTDKASMVKKGSVGDLLDKTLITKMKEAIDRVKLRNEI